MPGKTRKRRRKRNRKPPAKNSWVYVIDLEVDVLKCTKFREANPSTLGREYLHCHFKYS